MTCFSNIVSLHHRETEELEDNKCRTGKAAGDKMEFDKAEEEAD
jgi:hypothetical protein